MLTMVDLFCGAGIGAVGFKNAGFSIIKALDNNPYAVEAYNANIGNHAVVADIRKCTSKDIPYADVFVGGFPCKPFSEAGKGLGAIDKTNGDLGLHFFRLVMEIKPRAFIIENVAGLAFNKHRAFLDMLVDSFKEIGYSVKYKLVNCADYGVPQDRKRIFIVGVLGNDTFEFPNSSSDKVTLLESIGDLPEPSDLYKDINHSEYYDGGFSPRYTSRNRQRQWGEQSFTIVSTARQLPLHPSPPNYDIRKSQIGAPRRFTVRECLRIQTVPDTFIFPTHIPLLKQYERCSGIPSAYAQKLGEQLTKCLTY